MYEYLSTTTEELRWLLERPRRATYTTIPMTCSPVPATFHELEQAGARYADSRKSMVAPAESMPDTGTTNVPARGCRFRPRAETCWPA